MAETQIIDPVKRTLLELNVNDNLAALKTKCRDHIFTQATVHPRKKFNEIATALL